MSLPGTCAPMSGKTLSSTRCITWRCSSARSARSTRPRAIGRMGPARGVHDSPPPARGAHGQARQARVRAGVAAAGSVPDRGCRGRRARCDRPRRDRLRRSEASGAVSDRAPADQARHDGVSLPAERQRGDHLRQGLPGSAQPGSVMTDTPQALLAHHLKALKLPTFLREYDKLARQCATDAVDHVRYLLRLAELELIERERRMVERRVKEARFPAVKSLDSFDFLALPSLNKTLVLELARSEYVLRRENVIAVGNSGTGKSHVALGLGLAACQKGLSVGFTTAAAVVHELIEARDEKRLLRLQRQLAGYKLLVIDELGYVPLSQTGAELLFERLTHHVHILEMNGDSYRLKQSKRRQRAARAASIPDIPPDE